jgi:hypothetical protein
MIRVVFGDLSGMSNPAGFAAAMADTLGGTFCSATQNDDIANPIHPSGSGAVRSGNRRFLDLEDRATREFLGRLLDLWDCEQERIRDGGLAEGETVPQWEERMRKKLGYTPLRLPDPS